MVDANIWKTKIPNRRLATNVVPVRCCIPHAMRARRALSARSWVSSANVLLLPLHLSMNTSSLTNKIQHIPVGSIIEPLEHRTPIPQQLSMQHSGRINFHGLATSKKHLKTPPSPPLALIFLIQHSQHLTPVLIHYHHHSRPLTTLPKSLSADTGL